MKTYVGARGTNVVSSFHMVAFARRFAAGATVAEASERSQRAIRRTWLAWPLRWLTRRLLNAVAGEGDGDLAATLETSRPIVFGEGALTMGVRRGVTFGDVARAALLPPTPGFVARLAASTTGR